MSITPTQLALMEAVAAKTINANKGLHMMPFYISGFLDSLLFGIAISQVFSYSRFIKTDKKHILVLVFLAFAGTTAASIDILLWMQHLFVWNFGKYLTFSELGWLTRYMYIDVMTTLLVQIFYIDRACRLFQHWWPALFIGPFALAATGVGIALIEIVFKSRTMITPDAFGLSETMQYAYSWFSLLLTTDLIITAVIVYGLHRVKTGWRNTDSKLHRLIVQSFESQVPALIIAIVSLITWNQQFEIALPFVLLQTKVYVLGMLITLNLRERDSTAGAVNISYPSESGRKHSQAASYHMDYLSHDGSGGAQVDGPTPNVDLESKDVYGSTTYLTGQRV